MRGLAPQPHGTHALPGDVELYDRSGLPIYVIIESSPLRDSTLALGSERCGGAHMVSYGYAWHASRSKRLSGGKSRQLWRPKCSG